MSFIYLLTVIGPERCFTTVTFMHIVRNTVTLSLYYCRVLLVGTTKLNWQSMAHRLMPLRGLVASMECKKIIEIR